jgi:hypothetical protein
MMQRAAIKPRVAHRDLGLVGAIGGLIARTQGQDKGIAGGLPYQELQEASGLGTALQERLQHVRAFKPLTPRDRDAQKARIQALEATQRELQKSPVGVAAKLEQTRREDLQKELGIETPETNPGPDHPSRTRDGIPEAEFRLWPVE